MKKLLVSVMLANLLTACASQKQISEIEDKLFPAIEISGIEADTISVPTLVTNPLENKHEQLSPPGN